MPLKVEMSPRTLLLDVKLIGVLKPTRPVALIRLVVHLFVSLVIIPTNRVVRMRRYSKLAPRPVGLTAVHKRAAK